MGRALVFMLAIALSLQASAQSPTQAKHHLFTAKDYETYFSEGDFRIEAPTYHTVATEQARRTAKGLMVSTVETGPNPDRNSPYPFEKRKGVRIRTLGVFDAKLNVLVYQLTDADFQAQVAAEIWRSKDNRTTISAGDVRAGNLGDSIRADAKAHGFDPEQGYALYRRAVIGKWTLRCEFVDAPTYDVECIQTNPAKDYQITRRYRKQAGMS